MRSRTLALLALAGLAPALPVRAEDPKPPDQQPPRFQSTVDVEEELPAIPPSSSTVTKMPVPVQDLPVSVSVVPKRLLSDQDAFVLKDALENASGVNTAAGFGVFDYFVVRGFDSLTSGLVLTDGAPEPESTFYPTYNVRQVEVLKGPGAFVYGADAFAGTVNLVRKTPTTGRFADVTLTYGRFDTFEAAADANASSADGKVAFRLNGVYQGTSQYRDLPYASLGAVNPTLTWRPDDKTHVNVGFEYVRSHQAPDTGIPFVGGALAPVPRTTSYQSPLDDSVQNAYRVRFDVDHRFGDAFTLRNKFYFTELDWNSDGSLVSAVFPLPPDQRLYVARALTLLDDKQKFCGDQLEAVLAFKTGSVHHDLVGGFEFTWRRDTFTQDVAFLPPIDLLAPVETTPPPVVTIPSLGQAGDSRGIVLAPYVLDRMTFSKKWQLLAGARLNTLNYDDPVNATSRNDTRVDPVGGLTFWPTSDLSFYVSGGTAYAPPSTQVVGARDPETGWQAEAGAKLAFLSGKGLATAAVYDLTKNDIAIPDSSGITKQVGDQRARGFELEVSAQPTKGWVAYATYAYTDAVLTNYSELVSTGATSFLVLDRSGNRAPFAPRHLATLWTSRQFDKLGLALGLRYLSSQVIAPDNQHAIDGYATLDAAVSYRIGRVRAAVNFKNLTNTEYETRGFGSLAVVPARPFEVLARLELGFGARAR